MSIRNEVEQQLSELTQAELAEFVVIGAAMLARLQGTGRKSEACGIKADNELVIYFRDGMANEMQGHIDELFTKFGGSQVEIKL